MKRAAPVLFLIFGLLAAIQWERGETFLLIGFGLASICFAFVWLFAPAEDRRGDHR